MKFFRLNVSNSVLPTSANFQYIHQTLSEFKDNLEKNLFIEDQEGRTYLNNFLKRFETMLTYYKDIQSLEKISKKKIEETKEFQLKAMEDVFSLKVTDAPPNTEVFLRQINQKKNAFLLEKTQDAQLFLLKKIIEKIKTIPKE